MNVRKFISLIFLMTSTNYSYAEINLKLNCEVGDSLTAIHETFKVEVDSSQKKLSVVGLKIGAGIYEINERKEEEKHLLMDPMEVTQTWKLYQISDVVISFNFHEHTYYTKSYSGTTLINTYTINRLDGKIVLDQSWRVSSPSKPHLNKDEKKSYSGYCKKVAIELHSPSPDGKPIFLKCSLIIVPRSSEHLRTISGVFFRLIKSQHCLRSVGF